MAVTADMTILVLSMEAKDTTGATRMKTTTGITAALDGTEMSW